MTDFASCPFWRPFSRLAVEFARYGCEKKITKDRPESKTPARREYFQRGQELINSRVGKLFYSICTDTTLFFGRIDCFYFVSEGSWRPFRALFSASFFSTSSDLRGACQDSNSTLSFPIRTSSSIRTPMSHHFLSQGLPAGI